MKRFSLPGFFAAFLFLSICAGAQTPTQTPNEPVLKISTTLIQLDVTVTDKKGNIVTDLKPEEFRVYENGRKQDITNFSFISLESKSASSANTNAPSKQQRNRNSIPALPFKLNPAQVRRTYALVVDDLGLSFENVPAVKQTLKKFIDEQIQPGDLVAIIRTGSGIGALQSFATDRRQLFAAIDKIRWNPQGRGGISSFTPMSSSLKDDLQGRQKADGSVRNPQGGEQEKEFQNQINEFRTENFSAGTLGALNYVIRGMEQLPGRKSVVLFSEGFQLLRSEGEKIKTTDTLHNLRVLADAANRASVVFYTIDPRGLVNPAFPSSESSAAPNLDEYANFLDTQRSLQYLAYETGGLPFINQNNLNLGLQRAVDDQSGYYLIGYQPDDETFDPKKNKFNNLKIEVTRPGLKIRHRSGFFGVADERIRAAAQTPQQKLLNALTSPFGAGEINLSLYPVFQNDAKDGNIIHTLVYIDAKDLKFSRESNGNRKANFDLVGMTFGDNGVPVNQLSKNYTIEVPEKTYQNMLANGFIYTVSMPMKKTGAYQFRIALRDTKSEAVGSVSQFIEVPNIKKRMALSSIVLDSFTPEDWQKVRLGASRESGEKSVLLDATVRKFKRGTILRYDYMIYNSKQNPKLTTQTRLIYDGRVIHEEDPAPFSIQGQADLMRVQASGALTLGKNLNAGTYLLQVFVVDENAKGKSGFATQFVEFEVIE